MSGHNRNVLRTSSVPNVPIQAEVTSTKPRKPLQQYSTTPLYRTKTYSNFKPRPVFSLLTPIPGHFDKPPAVVYTTDASEADDLVSCLRGPIGFDMEWRMEIKAWNPATSELDTTRFPTAVIQLADKRMVIVYHLIQGSNVLGPVLTALLSDPERLKVGVKIGSDAQRLVDDGLLQSPAGFLDLSKMARSVHSDWGGGELVSLTRQAERYLGFQMDKEAGVRMGRWDEKLDPDQVACEWWWTC